MAHRFSGPNDDRGKPVSYRQMFEKLYFDRLAEQARKAPLPTHIKLLLLVAVGVFCFVCSVPILVFIQRILRF